VIVRYAEATGIAQRTTRSNGWTLGVHCFKGLTDIVTQRFGGKTKGLLVAVIMKRTGVGSVRSERDFLASLNIALIAPLETFIW
jgi:hypothetical protein